MTAVNYPFVRCDGGDFNVAFAYSIFNGITEDSVYAYTGKSGKKCRSKTFPPSYFLQNGCYGGNGDEDELKLFLVNYGPQAVAINTVGTGLDMYSSGVFYDPACSSDPANADHAVVSFSQLLIILISLLIASS